MKFKLNKALPEAVRVQLERESSKQVEISKRQERAIFERKAYQASTETIKESIQAVKQTEDETPLLISIYQETFEPILAEWNADLQRAEFSQLSTKLATLEFLLALLLAALLVPLKLFRMRRNRKRQGH